MANQQKRKLSKSLKLNENFKLILLILIFQVSFDENSMSSQIGNSRKRGPQKHQNSTAWKADKHKSDPKTKLVQSLTVTNCCQHCTGVIEWKIKYGKYKPLTQPSKCVKCGEKRIKFAYHTLCQKCTETTGHCAKCNKPEEVVNKPEPTLAEAARLEQELKLELKALPERKRRTFLRYLRSEEESKSHVFFEDFFKYKTGFYLFFL